jgi:inosose dehydratase
MGMVAAGGFTPLGAGEVDLAAVADTLRAIDYTGWIVIEQDAPATGQDFEQIMAEQRANRDVLREVGI